MPRKRPLPGQNAGYNMGTTWVQRHINSNFLMTKCCRKSCEILCVCVNVCVCGPGGARWAHEGSWPSGWTGGEEEEAETRRRRPVGYEPIQRLRFLPLCRRPLLHRRVCVSLSSVSLGHQLQYVRLMKFLRQRGFTSTLLQPALFTGTTLESYWDPLE